MKQIEVINTTNKNVAISYDVKRTEKGVFCEDVYVEKGKSIKIPLIADTPVKFGNAIMIKQFSK